MRKQDVCVVIFGAVSLETPDNPRAIGSYNLAIAVDDPKIRSGRDITDRLCCHIFAAFVDE